MTNRIELKWDLDYAVDEQRYYCLETPIDIENLPAPKAVLAGDVSTYIDYDIIENEKYYIRVSSVKNDTEKFSDESIVETTNDRHFYRVNLSVKDGIFTDKGTSGYTWSGISSMTLLNDDTFLLNAVTTYKTNENFVFTGQSIIEFEFFVETWAYSGVLNFICNMEGWTWGGIQLAVGAPSFANTSLKNKLFFATYGTLDLISSVNVDYTQWNKVTLVSYVDGMHTLFLNNVQVARGTISATPSTGPIHLQGYGIKYRNFKVKDLGNVPRVKLKVNSNNTVYDLGFEKFTWQVPSNVSLDSTNNQIGFLNHNASMRSDQVFYWSDAWTIKFKVFMDSTGLSDQNSIVGNVGMEWISGAFFIGYGGPAGGSIAGKLYINVYGIAVVTFGAMSTGAWHTITISKDSKSNYTVKIDDASPVSGSHSSSYIPKNNPIYFFSAGVYAMGTHIRDFEIY